MSSSPEPTAADRLLRRLQLVVSALAAGVLVFGVVSYVLRQGGTFETPAEGASAMVALLLVAFGLGVVLATALLRRALLARLASRRSELARPQLDDQDLLQTFSTLTIVQAALVESFALLAIVLFLLTGSSLALTAGAAALVLLLARATRLRASLGHLAASVVDPTRR